MEVRPITSDIMVLREEHDRSIVVRGEDFATAIDVPAGAAAVSAMIRVSQDMSRRGLGLAILTHESKDVDVPMSRLAGARLIRPDRQQDSPHSWEVIPRRLLRVPAVPVQLVRERVTVRNDSGRSFNLKPQTADCLCLEVLIEPDNILVVCDDLSPIMPPRIAGESVGDGIERFEAWRNDPPSTLIPRSGVPLSGDVLSETLDLSIEYLKLLRDRISREVRGSRSPGERLVYTLPCASFWAACRTDKEVFLRHKQNVLDIARELRAE